MNERDRQSSTRTDKSLRYAVSANRGRAHHRVRYVESGGGTPDSGCRVCAPMVPAHATDPTDDGSEPAQ